MNDAHIEEILRQMNTDAHIEEILSEFFSMVAETIENDESISISSD